MNTFKIFLFLILTGLCVSCSGDGDDGDDNPSEVQCPTEVTFTQDGSAVTLPIIDFGNGPSAIFQLKDPSPFNPDGVSRALAIRLQSGLEVFDVALEHNVDDATSCIPLGIYNTETLSSSNGILSFTYSTGGISYIVGLGEGDGILEITECDFDRGLISGTFSANMVQPFTYESIQITNGVFQNVCLEK